MPYLPNAITRKERYYEYLAAGTGDIPDPVTREEQYLYYLCKNRGSGISGTIDLGNITIGINEERRCLTATYSEED